MSNLISASVLLIAYILIRLIYRRNKTIKFGAPFVPLEPEVVIEVIKLSEIKQGDIFYDLGSGDGRLVIAAALAGARAYGVEVDPLRVWYSRLWIKLLGLSENASIINKNIFDVDLKDADIISAFLLQKTNDKLITKLEKETKKGTRIIGVAFKFADWKPVKIDPKGSIYGPLYLYIR